MQLASLLLCVHVCFARKKIFGHIKKVGMYELDTDEYPWLHADDPWFERSYIGDHYDKLYAYKRAAEPLVAVFYDSDGEMEEFPL